MKVHVDFLGIPKIYIDNIWIKMDKNKLNAIILYILYNEECTRDELSAMFWPDNNEQRAKSNLRNAIYQIRQKLGEDFLDADGHSFVGLNPDIEITKDIDIFLDQDNGEKILELNEFSFMDKIYLKNNNEFNDWLFGVRRAYENLVINILNSELDNSLKSKNTRLAEEFANKIVSIDPYNEKAYREKIKINIINHDFNEGIKNYKEIEKNVKEELDVPLEDETVELYDFMVNNKNNVDIRKNKDYFERADLSLIIRREYDKFAKGENFDNIIVRGEIGVGKSKLIENFVKGIELKQYVLELNPTMTNIDLLAFTKLLKLFNIKPSENIIDSLLQVEEKFAGDEKFLLYIKNLEYVDRKSFDYFLEMFINNSQSNIFILAEFSNSLADDMEIYKKLKTINNIINIEVPLLNQAETIDYIKLKYPKFKPEKIDYSTIYNKTFGNIMFIDEYIIGEKNSGGIIGKLINSFSEEELDVLKKASIFNGYFTIEYLNLLVDMEKTELLNIIERLFLKGVLYEEDLKITIKYNSLDSTIYNLMPKVYRVELHKYLAREYEKREEMNYESYKFLSYHYGKAENYYKKYNYHLMSLQLRLDYYDQLFPTLINSHDRPKDLYTNREAYYEEFNNMYKNINKIRYATVGKDYYKLVMLLEFLIGRTMIGGGKKEEGIKHIDKVIGMAKKLDNDEYLLKAYIEYIHYGIHKEDNVVMKKYIDLSKEMLDMDKFYIESAEVLRLEGLYELKTNNLDRAERLLLRSIDVYSIPELANRNMFPIIAANNYLGNLYREKGNYKKAEKYYLDAIKIGDDHDIMKSLDIVYADYGHMLYIKGDYHKAEQVLNKAIVIYDTLGTHWKRTIVESLMGKIAYYDRDYKGAITHLRRGEIFSKKDQKPEEIKLLNDLKEKISKIK